MPLTYLTAGIGQAPFQRDGKGQYRSRVAEVNRDITNATSYLQILDIAVEHSHIYDSVNTATSLHRIAKQRPTDADMEVRRT